MWRLCLDVHFLSPSLSVQVPIIVKALHKQLKEKSVKTRQCCFNMLTELVNVLPGALTHHIPVLVPGERRRRRAGAVGARVTKALSSPRHHLLPER